MPATLANSTRYLSTGIKQIGDVPIGAHSGLNWEFHAIVEGRRGIVLGPDENLPLQSRRLWIFPPHHRHGWHGDEKCRSVILHCAAVPRQLAEAMPATGYLERELTETECLQIAETGEALQAGIQDRNPLGDLRFDRAIFDLALLALEGTAPSAPHTANRRMADKVDAALAWFRRHLKEQPSLEEVAGAVHVSASHLRRMFVNVLHQNPRTVFGDTQIEVAMRLLSGSDLKIDSIASEAGFASARDFSRVFSARQGCSPSDWRRQVAGRG